MFMEFLTRGGQCFDLRRLVRPRLFSYVGLQTLMLRYQEEVLMMVLELLRLHLWDLGLFPQGIPQKQHLSMLQKELLSPLIQHN